MLLKTSNPPTFHSPLSPVYKDPTRRAPWTEEASSLINLIVFYEEILLAAVADDRELSTYCHTE
jgi:hypothetical protein